MTVGELLGEKFSLDVPIVGITLGKSAVINSDEGRQILLNTALMLSILNPILEVTFDWHDIKYIAKAGKVVTHKILPESVT